MTDLERAERGYARELVWNYRWQTSNNGKERADKWLQRALVGVANAYGTSERVLWYMREIWRDGGDV